MAALLVGDIGSIDDERDIVVEIQDGNFQHVYKSHPMYLPLQYPFLFLHGEDGYTESIPQQGAENQGFRSRWEVSRDIRMGPGWDTIP